MFTHLMTPLFFLLLLTPLTSAASPLQSSLQSAMNNAMLIYQSASAIDQSPFDDHTKAAWADCVRLYEDTITLLSISMKTASSMMTASSNQDTQTWLSAAIATQQTCRDGFIELNSSQTLLSSPFMSNDVSDLTCKSLALAKTVSTGGNRKLLSHAFPRWVSAADRKLLQSSTIKADIVVAQDGSGDYKTISEAVAASVKIRKDNNRFVIHVKTGVYNENVEVTNMMTNLMIVGDGIDATVVTGSKNVQDGSTTLQSATFGVAVAPDHGFIARDMTFENTAGPEKQQVVALRLGSDHSVYYRCSFKGYQDTLYVQSNRQFYSNCDIYGTVDFIFGDAAVVFQSCNIYVRKPMTGQNNVVTAQGRWCLEANTGISIHNSTIAAAPDLQPVQGLFETYLGRPWKQYSRTVLMKTSLGSLIHPAGWQEWNGDFALSTLYYGEYMNGGPGAATGGRVNWPGYHVMSLSEAEKFTVGNFLSGDLWIPATGVPYTSGL